MVIECCVPYCKTKATSGFHKFPANRETRLQWIKSIQIFHLDEATLADSFKRVCNKHFLPKDYQTHASGLTRLKHNSVPSQYLPNPIWMEHSYVSEYRNATKSNIFKPVKKLRTKILKKKLEPKGVVVDFGQGDILLSSSHEEEIKVLKAAVFELKEKLRFKDRIIASINKKLRLKGKQLQLLRQKLKANKMNKDNVMSHLRGIFDKDQVLFFEMQFKNAGKQPNARRYSPEEKSFCLAIYKQSPRTYRRLRDFFTLPSKRSLGRHSAKMIFESGLNCNFFKFLTTTVIDMNDIDKYCTLIWDEMALRPHLDYSEKRDVIDGFVELISLKRPNFATHALTFMVRGINKAYKEPVAYFYTDGLKHFELVALVKLVGEAVLDTGLKVINSVCDQVSTNISTVNLLMGLTTKSSIAENQGQLLTYKLREATVIHCWDIPHLIKGTRNNLRTKNLSHFVSKRWNSSDSNSTEEVNKKRALMATWDDVSDLYDLNLKGSQKLLNKITPEHINPNRAKMKVSVAAQVFSQTYGEVMLHCSEKQLKRDCSGTAQILIFFNDLFDSMNGSCSVVNQLNSPVTKDSVHFRYWKYALSMLSEMQFIDKITGKITYRTKNLQNWQSTIRGYFELSKKCLSLGMTEVALRYTNSFDIFCGCPEFTVTVNTNQDGLENFFGQIKLNCQVSKTPIPIHFRSAYITQILNNLTCTNSMKSNCEKDDSTALLNNFHKIVLTDKKFNCDQNNDLSDENKDFSGEEDFLDTVIFDPQISQEDLNFVEKEEMTYISSVICNKLMQEVTCKVCRNDLETFTEVSAHDIIAANSCNFKYPSDAFISNLTILLRGIDNLLPDICTKTQLKKTLISDVSNINLDNMGCKRHNQSIKNKFINHTVSYAIMAFCKNINDLLSNKNKILPPNFEGVQIYEVALNYGTRKKKIGKFIDDDKDEDHVDA